MNWRFDAIIIAVAVALAAAVIFVAWWLWWQLPKRQTARLGLTEPKDRNEVEDNFRKTFTQLLGGAAVLIGAALAYLQFTQQQQASQQQFSHQQQASRDLLISNQVAKGFEQLGSDKLLVRLGGIYALEGVMNTSEQYHMPVLEALSAFIRDSTRTEKGDDPPATDVQAALTVIARRSAIGKEGPDFTNAHIPKAGLNYANRIDAALTEATLTGAFLVSANLTSANLTQANLTGAILTALYREEGGPERKAHANLKGARLDDADLRGATVTQAQLDQACGTGVKLDPGLTIKPCP